MTAISPEILATIEAIVAAYTPDIDRYKNDAEILESRLKIYPGLDGLIHSTKTRAKSIESLRNRLMRIARWSVKYSKPFPVTPDNLPSEITDLSGVRLLHLHMNQITKIHPAVLQMLEEEHYVIVGTPEAKSWDLEYRLMLGDLKLKVVENKKLYTSVHYIVKSNQKATRTCELQVRTLADEIWGETSHKVAYPDETKSIACKEQLLALARVVSGCSRLVDSIFASHEEFDELSKQIAGSNYSTKNTNPSLLPVADGDNSPRGPQPSSLHPK